MSGREFYQPGHTYSYPVYAEGYDWKFRADAVVAHPENGEWAALGWRFFRGEWEPYAYGEDDWDVQSHDPARSFVVQATELAEAVAELGALPVPVGPQMPDFPPPPATELEQLHAERARLQGLLAEAVADVHRARQERDDMRERVSEPYGCAHCGIAKRGHGRRWTTGVGSHAWTAPTQDQIAERMKARRTVRVAADTGRLRARVAELESNALSAGGAADRYAARAREGQTALQEMLAALLERQIERDAALARVAELEAERHVTNEALDDAVQALRANRDQTTPTQALPGLLVEQSHQLDPSDAAFAALACACPEACSRDADYPRWTAYPGGGAR